MKVGKVLSCFLVGVMLAGSVGGSASAAEIKQGVLTEQVKQ